MSKKSSARDSEALKQKDKGVQETSSGLIQPVSSHASFGAIRTIGESPVGIIRQSSYGTYSRVVMMAIDGSPVAKYAFQCKSCAVFSR